MTTLIATFEIGDGNLNHLKSLLGNIAKKVGTDQLTISIRPSGFTPGARPQDFATFPAGRVARIDWYQSEGFSQTVSQKLAATTAEPIVFFRADMKIFAKRSLGEVVKNAIQAWQDWRQSQETT